MQLFERIKRTDLNVYDLVRLNESNVNAMITHATYLDNNFAGITFEMSYNEQRRILREVSETLAETNYSLRNNLNEDLLNELESNPISEA